ncbi:MAG: hypothetical protein Rubg2KO_01900 [Rubricoccaceae bacterium]
MRLLFLIASAMLASSALAQTPGTCTTGTAQAFLDVSDVQARLLNNGGLFGDLFGRSGGYLAPKLDGAPRIDTASLWIGGLVEGEIRTTSSRTDRNRQMWPGPLDEGAELPNPDDCSAYDRIYTVSTHDVAIYEQIGLASSDLSDWPVGLGAPAVDASGQPVVVTSREQTLELANGERPVISGTQTAFWVMNDVGNEHTDYEGNVQGSPLGVEVAVTAFAVASEEAALHQGTFYRYTVTNQNAQPITDAVLGIYTNPYEGDDFAGVDTTRGLGFSYSGYGARVGQEPYPAVGFDLLDGLGAFVMTRNDDYCTSGLLPPDVYGVLNGLWPDGSPITENGLGCNNSGPITRFAYAGDPVTESFWSMNNLDGGGIDMPGGYFPFTAASPHFDLQSGESRTFGLAILFARGTDHLDSITELRAASDWVQAAYDDGSLFETTAPTPLLASPTLLSPTPPDVLTDSTVAFAWDPVPDAEFYRLELSRSESFADATVFFVASPAAEIRISDDLVGNEPTHYYWRVRAESRTRRSLWSAGQSFVYYRYIGRLLTLADGSPAFIEVAGPDGADPCAEGAQSPDGCEDVFGNLVYESLNSTGDYYVGSGQRTTDSQASLPLYAPNDFEIRFTEGGGLGTIAFWDSSIVRVPFEIWDIGAVAPGEVNDPSDDVRLIPVFLARNGGTCAFDVAASPGQQAGYVESDWIYAYYPSTTYAEYETAFSALVDAGEGCYAAPREAAFGYIDSSRGRPPIQRQVLGSLSEAPALPATGTVIRFYTTNPFFPVADEEAPARSGALTLGPAYPNPTASALTVPYRLASSSPVELAVFDVLGRQVVEVVNTRQPEGAHTAELNASTLAPGVYIIQLRAGDETRTTRITVVR